METRVERNNKEKVLRRVAKLLAEHGFRRSKSTFFTRVAHPVIEFVHLHKFTFGPKFRVHLGIRVINEPFEAIHLNGPDSTFVLLQNGKERDFSYSEHKETLDRCASDIGMFVSDTAEPWFATHRDLKTLAFSATSPLCAQAKEALSRAMHGHAEEHSVSQTRALLNAP